ncbi:MAG: amidohydrolase family protein, partial [Thermodesulfobacteriota bacterium]
GPESGRWNIQLFERIKDKLSDVSTRLRDMDKARVDVQILSPSPIMLYYWADIETGVTLSRLQNERISEVCRQYPSRFLGIGTVPLQGVDEAVKELERLSKELKLKGVIISSNVNGMDLDDPVFFPFFEKAERLDLLILVHPHDTAAAERMQRFYLTNLIGNPLDTTIAATRIIFSGLLEKLPGLKICFAHGGGHLPYIMGRIHHGYVVRPECRGEIQRSPWEYFQRLYFDTITHYLPALEYLVKTVGSEHVLMGSDYPYDMGDEDPVASVQSLSIPEFDKKKILGENLRRLLGMEQS